MKSYKLTCFLILAVLFAIFIFLLLLHCEPFKNLKNFHFCLEIVDGWKPSEGTRDAHGKTLVTIVLVDSIPTSFPLSLDLQRTQMLLHLFLLLRDFMHLWWRSWIFDRLHWRFIDETLPTARLLYIYMMWFTVIIVSLLQIILRLFLDYRHIVALRHNSLTLRCLEWDRSELDVWRKKVQIFEIFMSNRCVRLEIAFSQLSCVLFSQCPESLTAIVG